MRCGSAVVVLTGVLATLAIQSAASGPFVLFPKASPLASPDGRFVVSTAPREASPSQFAGTFDTLWLTEVGTGRTRRLCDYFGVAAVAWSGNDFLLVTQYVGKKASRALVIAIAHPEDSVLLDSATLSRLVPLNLQTTLRQNDHIFIEAARVQGYVLQFRVWGYGQHDPGGFRWQCEYSFSEATVQCADERHAN